MQSGTLCRAPPALARNDLKIIALQCAHDDGLYYSALANRIRKFAKLVVREQTAWIARVGTQVLDGSATGLSTRVDNRCFLANVANERGQATSQSRVIRHCHAFPSRILQLCSFV
jgi:hypothetical protein